MDNLHGNLKSSMYKHQIWPLLWLVRQQPFATSPVLKLQRLHNQHLSTKTLRNCLRAAGKASQSYQTPPRGRLPSAFCLTWCLEQRARYLTAWWKIHCWMKEGSLLHVMDGWLRFWRHRNRAIPHRNIRPTVLYREGSVMIWGCISHNFKLDPVTIQGNLKGYQYIRVLEQVVHHFSKHQLASRPQSIMDDHTRPWCSQALQSTEPLNLGVIYRNQK